MPPLLKIEAFSPKVERWILAGEIRRGDKEGSLSDNTTEGRDLYLFGVHPTEDLGYVAKSVEGTDTMRGKERKMTSSGFVIIAALRANETHEMTFTTDKNSTPRTVRFTYTND